MASTQTRNKLYEITELNIITITVKNKDYYCELNHHYFLKRKKERKNPFKF